MKKYLVEFIGTFFLVLTICMTVLGGVGDLAPLAIGTMLIPLVYAGGYISGAHYNPAVTVAVFLCGKCKASDVVPYIIAQIVASLSAVFVSAVLLDALGADAAKPMELKPTAALLAEFLGTFALVYVILNTAIAKGTEGNSFYGVAIGLVVVACVYAFGDVSGGVFNPAVALGVTIAGMSFWANIWIFLLANFLGGAIAAYTFKFVNGDK